MTIHRLSPKQTAAKQERLSMGAKKWKLSTLELLEFALVGVNTEIGVNIGNPDWSREDWEFHVRTRGEIERRIKILTTQEQAKLDKEF